MFLNFCRPVAGQSVAGRSFAPLLNLLPLAGFSAPRNILQGLHAFCRLWMPDGIAFSRVGHIRHSTRTIMRQRHITRICSIYLTPMQHFPQNVASIRLLFTGQIRPNSLFQIPPQIQKKPRRNPCRNGTDSAGLSPFIASIAQNANLLTDKRSQLRSLSAIISSIPFSNGHSIPTSGSSNGMPPSSPG